MSRTERDGIQRQGVVVAVALDKIEGVGAAVVLASRRDSEGVGAAAALASRRYSRPCLTVSPNPLPPIACARECVCVCLFVCAGA